MEIIIFSDFKTPNLSTNALNKFQCMQFQLPSYNIDSQSAMETKLFVAGTASVTSNHDRNETKQKR